METIHKYQLDLYIASQTLQLPKGYNPMQVQVQNGVACLWCAVNNAETEFEEVTIHAVTTGGVIPDDLNGYLGTTQHHNGTFVLHWFF